MWLHLRATLFIVTRAIISAASFQYANLYRKFLAVVKMVMCCLDLGMLSGSGSSFASVNGEKKLL